MPGAIPTHRAALPCSVAAKLYDQRSRDRVSAAFYQSRAWRRLRAEVLRDEPLCRDCRLRGRRRVATEVHHERELRAHPSLALDRDNLTPLCKRCHNARRSDFVES